MGGGPDGLWWGGRRGGGRPRVRHGGWGGRGPALTACAEGAAGGGASPVRHGSRGAPVAELTSGAGRGGKPSPRLPGGRDGLDRVHPAHIRVIQERRVG